MQKPKSQPRSHSLHICTNAEVRFSSSDQSSNYTLFSSKNNNCVKGEKQAMFNGLMVKGQWLAVLKQGRETAIALINNRIIKKIIAHSLNLLLIYNIKGFKFVKCCHTLSLESIKPYLVSTPKCPQGGSRDRIHINIHMLHPGAMTEEHLVQKMSDFVFSQCSPFSEMKKDAF